MAGYVIHLAVGEEYIRNYPNEIKNHDEFLDGIIYPDSVGDKSITHYGPKSSQVNLKLFFAERDLNTDFNKGYFVHLVTDYLFYNKFISAFSKKYIYNDYDITNSCLEKEFNVVIPDKIRSRVFYKEGKTKILDINETINFIKETAKYNLNNIKEAVLNNDENWLKIRLLNEIKI